MKKIEVKTILSLGIAVFLLYLAIHFWPAVAAFLGGLLKACSPLLIGAAIAYIIDLPMSFLELHWFPHSKKKAVAATRKPLCLVIAVVTLIAVVSVVVGLVIPQLVSCIRLLIERIPAGIQLLLDLLERYHLLSDEVLSILEGVDWKSRFDSILNMVGSGFTGAVNVLISTVTGVLSGLVTALISFIFAIYILLSKDKLKHQFLRLAEQYLPQTWCHRGAYFLSVLDHTFRRYIIGQTAEAVILGSLCAMGMVILKIPFAAMIGALIAFTALIPVAGAYIGAGVSALMILSADPVKALVFLIFIVILQQIEGNLIYPRVVGSSLKLPGIWVLAAVTVGGGIAGVGGMLLGVPLVAALYRILSDDLHRREAASLPKEEAEEE